LKLLEWNKLQSFITVLGRPLTVAGYSREDFSLAPAPSQFPLPLPFCSIRIQYSGAPGSMEAEVSSVEARSDLVVDARVENEGNGWAGSGDV